jgi:arylsulfatase A
MQNRRKFLELVGTGGLALTLSRSLLRSDPRRPNVIFILADDLGYGELGCFGQKKIKTPNIDRLAREGMRFAQHYSGSPVCAPSRCVLLTGKHTGHAYIRDNDEMAPPGTDVWQHPEIEGQRPLAAGTFTLGTLFQRGGFKTAGIGKWGLGGPGTAGQPNLLGFDHFYGYLCQRQAHNSYPDHLWREIKKEPLANTYFSPHQKLPADKDPNDPQSYVPYLGKQYSFDVMLDDALNFIRANQGNPFFIYFTPTIPHLALQVPEDSVKEYEGAFPETPYKGESGYLPNRTPRATYAGMISRLDRGVGRIMDLLRELRLDENTLVIFTSDNGATATGGGGADTSFFESNGALRGQKATLYEGGIRVPLIARWPGTVAAGTVNSLVCAFWDFLPTFADLLGNRPPADTDGTSILPALLGNDKLQKQHEYLYWEYAKQYQAVRMGQWKAVRPHPSKPIEVYDLKTDEAERVDIAGRNLKTASLLAGIMNSAHTKSALFPLAGEK